MRPYLPPFLAMGLILAACVSREEYDAALSTSVAFQTQAALSGATASAEETRRAAERAEAEATAATFATEVASVSRERNEAISRATRLQGQLDIHICEETLPTMDYGSIADASTILAAFVAQQPWAQRVQGTFRNTIWNNTDSKLHAVRYVDSSDHMSYATYFMVYFKEYGWDRGVFWIDRQCWLDK